MPGISFAGAAVLFARFPQLRALFSGEEDSIAADGLIAMGAEIVAAFGAAGCGYPGNAEAEARFGAFNITVQTELLEAILTQTLPKGVGPFVEALTRMGVLLGVGGADVPKGGVIKLRAMKSREPSAA